jgi:hypothetical protein
MGSLFSKTLALFLVAVVVMAGCRQISRIPVSNLASGPNYMSLSTPSGSVAQAIEAAGGLEAWTAVKEIDLDCLMSFYQPDGSYYLTQQRYEIYPWTDSIRIFGDEPQDKYVWQYSDGRFTVLQGRGHFQNQPTLLGGGHLARLVLVITTIPARLLDSSFDFERVTTPVNIRGQWYYPLYRKSKGVQNRYDSIFYQNRATTLIDSVWYPRMGTVPMMVRGYDYQKLETEGIYIPSRIEIFVTDEQGNLKQRLAAIELNE